MKRALTLLGAIGLLAACASDPPLTERDAAALARLEDEFGEKLTFRPTAGLYLDARLRPNTRIRRSELERAYRRFFMDSIGDRRATRFVYLNLYDAHGRFVEQIFWSTITAELQRSNAERY